MSNLSTYPTPFQVVLKPSTYQSGNTRGGLNLNKWLPKFLKRIGFADTVDCCVYYPSVPFLEVNTINSPSETEAANVPLWGLFRTGNETEGNVWIKVNNDAFITLATWS